MRLNQITLYFFWKILLNPRLSPKQLRRNFDWVAGTEFASLQRRFPKSRFEQMQIAGVSCEQISAGNSVARRILYIHGGGFLMGSIKAYRQFALKLSYETQSLVILPEYPLAPEQPFPAALNTLTLVYQTLRNNDPNTTLIVGGDSAGGGLSLSLFLKLKSMGEPLPHALFCISPWADLMASGATYLTHAHRDRCLNRKNLSKWSQDYCQGKSPSDPLISPVFGDFAECPPLLLMVGDQEVLFDDSVRVASAAKSHQEQVELHIGKNMQHDWPLIFPHLPESKAAYARLKAFILTQENPTSGNKS